MAALLQQAGLAARLESQPVFDAYRSAVGETVAHRAKAVRLRGGVLEVEVTSSALLHDLRHFQASRILQHIQSTVTQPRVESIRFRLGAERASR